MRLWHKDLIPYLPRKQLSAQWRECCAIASNLSRKGTSNHLLVNKVLSSRGDFYAYCSNVIGELENRGYKISFKVMKACFDNILACNNFETNSTHFEIFPQWHNKRYLKQCLFNLQEKYDCGGISKNLSILEREVMELKEEYISAHKYYPHWDESLERKYIASCMGFNIEKNIIEKLLSCNVPGKTEEWTLKIYEQKYGLIYELPEGLITNEKTLKKFTVFYHTSGKLFYLVLKIVDPDGFARYKSIFEQVSNAVDYFLI